MKRLVRYVLRRRKAAPSNEPPGPPKLVIFDFDGTIADTFDAAFVILNKLADEFGFRRLEAAELEKARDMRTRQLMKFLKIPMSRMNAIARRGSEEIRARMPEIQPLAGVPGLLRELHAAGYELGMVTSNSEDNVRMFLQKFDLDLFVFIRSSSKLLGKAHELRVLMKTRRVAAKDILFVGDETRDIEAAKKAGIPMAAVTWGYNSVHSLEAMKPEFVFDKPSDLGLFLKEKKQ